MAAEVDSVSGRLLLFVAGDSPRAGRAEANLRRLISLLPADLPRPEIEVIDVVQRADLAEEWLVLATPLVIRQVGDSVSRAVGDFADLRRLADAINLPLSTEALEKGLA